MIAQVALAIPYSTPYDYVIPEELLSQIQPGIRVLVPFHWRMMIGVVVKINSSSTVKKLKEIREVVGSEPIIDSRILELTQWIAQYYLSSWGEVLDAAIPTSLKPKVEKIVQIKQEAEKWALLSPETQQWLLTLQGMKYSKLSRTPSFQQTQSLFKKVQRQGIIKFEFELSKFPTSSQQEEWLLLHPENLKQLKTRKGSKASLIIELLQSKVREKRQHLQEAVPNSGTVIRQLLKKEVLQTEWCSPWDETEKQQIHWDKFLELNPEQQKVMIPIQEAIQEQTYQTFLLHGVTGSGKTEIYLHAVRDTLQQEKTVLILIPEISLTPQTVHRFRERFGEQIAVLHSGMGDKERCQEWWKIKEKACSIVIGARSAIFAPLENIGLIVVDEEHDSSYKQQESPFYNARDTAVKVASQQQCVVILGSATPSVVSFHNAQEKKYHLLTLTKRANQQPMPKSEVINLKEEKRQKGVFYLSTYIVNKLRENFEKKKQALIFLNRRGYASFLACTACELPMLCHNCSIAMTWHQKHQSLICHHCGYRENYPQTCPACKHHKFRTEGIGTQRVERDLKILYPQARFLRMDRDTIQKKGALEQSIDLINQGKVDFIIGTQLISKGHDFQNIGIVSIILADMTLNIPDYRSSERGFQLLSQVSGRAGRGKDGGGMTLIQSYNPEHYSIKTALDHDYLAFYRQEIEMRSILNHPPVSREILIRLSEKNPHHVQQAAQELGAILQGQAITYKFQVLGPIESSIAKVNNRYYWEIHLNSNQIGRVKGFLYQLFWSSKSWSPKGGTRISINVDP